MAETPGGLTTTTTTAAATTSPATAASSCVIIASPDVEALVTALATAQASFPAVRKGNEAVIVGRSGSRYSYRYADLAEVIAAVRPVLNAHGIAVTQHPRVGRGTVEVTTRLSLGNQWLAATVQLPCDVSDARTIGSALTYARRYSLSALVTVAADQDDDAALVSASVPAEERQGTPAPAPAAAPEPPSSREPSPPGRELPPLPPGQVFVLQVAERPTSKPGVIRYTVTLSNGTVASTIKQHLAQAAQMAKDAGYPVVVSTNQSRWGLDLVDLIAIQDPGPESASGPEPAVMATTGNPVDPDDVPF